MQPTADFEIWSKYKVVINGIFYCQDDRTRKGGGIGCKQCFGPKTPAFWRTPKNHEELAVMGGGAVGLCQPDRKISVFWTTHLEGIAYSFFAQDHWPLANQKISKIQNPLALRLIFRFSLTTYFVCSLNVGKELNSSLFVSYNNS